MSIHRMLAGLLVCILLLLPAVVQGGTSPNPDSAGQGRRPSTETKPPTPEEIEMQRRMEKQRNKERFARLKKDTDRLLELATDLKKSVDAANEQTLSLDVIRKAEQIEKLAKDVREKMKGP